jgi:hypothetical protein
MGKKILLVCLFIVPYLVIALPGIPRWCERLIAVSLFLIVTTALVFWVGIDPKLRIIPATARIRGPEFDGIRPKIELGVRLLLLGFGIFVLLFTTWPLLQDLAHLSFGERPTQITRAPESRSVPLFGAWFVVQFVTFSPNERSYSLWYSLEPLQIGESYELVVLPRSRMILDFHAHKRVSGIGLTYPQFSQR